MFGCQLSNDVALLDDVSLPGDAFGVVASTTRRDICRPTGGQERVEEKIFNTPKNYNTNNNYDATCIYGARRKRPDKLDWENRR